MTIHVAHLVTSFDMGGLQNGIVNLVNHSDPSRLRHTVIAMKGEVRCVYEVSPDIESSELCTALEGIRKVGKPRVRRPGGNADRYTYEDLVFPTLRTLPAQTMTHDGLGYVSVDFLVPR